MSLENYPRAYHDRVRFAEGGIFRRADTAHVSALTRPAFFFQNCGLSLSLENFANDSNTSRNVRAPEEEGHNFLSRAVLLDIPIETA